MATVRLSALAGTLGVPLSGEDREITGITLDSRQVQPGQLFVAIPGANADGTRFIPDALERGAVAVCAVRPWDGVPTLVVDDPREALARLAAEFHGHPARDLRMIGITGSLGKTSTALLLETIIGAAGEKVGVIGSLGIRFEGHVVETGMTTPEAPAIHGSLRYFAAQGAGTAVMEVTSHSILLKRVDGLQYDLGLLTNIVPYEHLEFHPTPEHYVRTKTRFFGMLKPGAPLVVNDDDPTARQVSTGLDRPVIGVSLRTRDSAAVHVQRVLMGVEGSTFALHVSRPLPLLDGGEVPAMTIPLALPILGRQQVANAALAATAALIAGIPAETIAFALAGVEPMHRRMHILYEEGPVLLDDTVGNPESIRAVFEAIRSIPHHNLRIAYAIRGSRGTEVNERNAEALAREIEPTVATLIVTASEDHASERDRVEDEERDVVLRTLEACGVPYIYEPTLERAVTRAVEGAARGDLVALLGAQGMDKGGEIARRLLPPPVD
jgi:UDP-N-acetylmuramoyl-L-alanyl-D-glutamate--2,6-diaminopimelate ligase